jgi:hypothetical protein
MTCVIYDFLQNVDTCNVNPYFFNNYIHADIIGRQPNARQS